MNDVLRTVILAALVAASVLTVYHRWLTIPSRPMAIVDVGSIYRDVEREHVAALAQANTDAAKQVLRERYAAFQARLAPALAALGESCRCTVFLRSSLVSSPEPLLDLTSELELSLRSR